MDPQNKFQKDYYVGIALGGSRGHRTTVVGLDYFAGEDKIFFRVIHTQVQASLAKSADQKLLELLKGEPIAAIGVDAPLTMPPCITCDLPICPGFHVCDVDSIRWMREEVRDQKLSRLPSPYSQRPVDLLLRGRWQSESDFIPSDETLGSGRAPLAARMHYLKRHFSAPLLEVYPRLSLAVMAQWFAISDRDLRRVRDVEEGIYHRSNILDAFGKDLQGVPHLFLYENDRQTFVKDLNAFDALICALMPIYEVAGLLENPELDPSWGRIAKPKSAQSLGLRFR